MPKNTIISLISLEELVSMSTSEPIPAEKPRIVVKGGAGSGHHGHKGRPGEIGGSVPDIGVGQPITKGEGSTKSYTPKTPLGIIAQPTPVYEYNVNGRTVVGYDYPESEKMHQLMSEARNVYDRYGHLEGTQDLYGGLWHQASAADRSAVKQEIEGELSERSGVLDGKINELMAQWADTSNDTDLRSLSIQKAASEEFGVKMSKWQQESLDKAQQGKESAAKMGLTRPKYQQIIDDGSQRAVLRAMYENTQARLAKAGFKPNDEVYLYRGVIYDKDVRQNTGDVVNYHGNAMDSWSIARGVADTFASTDYKGTGVKGIIYGMKIPVRNIISTARTGNGCLTEGEVIVLGGSMNGNQATVVGTFYFGKNK